MEETDVDEPVELGASLDSLEGWDGSSLDPTYSTLTVYLLGMGDRWTDRESLKELCARKHVVGKTAMSAW